MKKYSQISIKKMTDITSIFLEFETDPKKVLLGNDDEVEDNLVDLEEI